MSEWTWKSNPHREKCCPICGGKAAHFSIPKEVPYLGWCWTPPTIPPTGWIATRNPNLFLQQHAVPPAALLCAPTSARQIPLADPCLRHTVYQQLLNYLQLSTAHRQGLLQRGFSLEEIQQIPFASLPSGPRTGLVERALPMFAGHDLAGIPGFYQNKYGQWTLAGSPGLLIPVCDHLNRIIAIQIRPNQPNTPANKYCWLSSKKRSAGCSPGAPAGVICSPGTAPSSGTVWVTEGFFKGLALAKRTGERVVWLAGVSMIQAALAQLAHLSPDRILVAFDTDWRTKPSVHAALFHAVLTIGQVTGVPTQAVTWDRSLGKGIDDALLRGGLGIDQLTYLGQDDLVVGLTPPATLRSSKYLRLESTATPAAIPVAEPQPTVKEIRAATEQALMDAYASPPGTIVLLTAGTGAGKSYSACQHAPQGTLFIDRDYDSAGQQKHKMLEQFGHDPKWIYGRQPPEQALAEPATATQKERSRMASCPDYLRASAAGSAGHNACQGCNHSPVEWGMEKCYDCGYRRHKDILRKNPPAIGQCVPEIGLSPHEIEPYTTLVFDDIPDLLYRIAGEQTVQLADTALWQENNAEEMPQTVLLFLEQLRAEMGQAKKKLVPVSETLRQAALLAWVEVQEGSNKPLPCEQPCVRDGMTVYPPRRVRPLLQALILGLPVELNFEQVIYRTCNTELLETLRHKRVIILDATPDTTLWESIFGEGSGFNLVIPELPKVTPRIVQVCDIHGSQKQIIRMAEPIKALAKREEAFIITRKGPCAQILNAEGWMGRHERGLNHLQDYKAGILAGNFSLPSEVSERIAQGMRALAQSMGTMLPDFTPPLRDKKGRTWRTYRDKAGRWVGLRRNTFAHSDPLAEHIGRHHHQSSVIQTWGRLRSDGILYLIAGTPMDDVPVTVMTLEELGLQPKETRGNPKLGSINHQKKQQAQERITKGVEQLRKWQEGHDNASCSLRQVKRLLAAEGNQETSTPLAQQVLVSLHKQLDEPTQQVSGMPSGVSHNYVIEETALYDTPPYHSANEAEGIENSFSETCYEPPPQEAIPFIACTLAAYLGMAPTPSPLPQAEKPVSLPAKVDLYPHEPLVVGIAAGVSCNPASVEECPVAISSPTGVVPLALVGSSTGVVLYPCTTGPVDRIDDACLPDSVHPNMG